MWRDITCIKILTAVLAYEGIAYQYMAPVVLKMSIMFDLNNLKRANDTYGHAVGDQLITNFARLLRNAIPAKDFVGRYGGDEFITNYYTDDKERNP